MKTSHSLTAMFAGLFRKQGYEVTEYACLECMEFKAAWIMGMVMFDKEKKCHRVRWKMREGYYLFDCPMALGWTSSEFHKAGDLLNFLQRRLVWKKAH
jgi:hypothetical protein